MHAVTRNARTCACRSCFALSLQLTAAYAGPGYFGNEHVEVDSTDIGLREAFAQRVHAWVALA